MTIKHIIFKLTNSTNQEANHLEKFLIINVDKSSNINYLQINHSLLNSSDILFFLI